MRKKAAEWQPFLRVSLEIPVQQTPHLPRHHFSRLRKPPGDPRFHNFDDGRPEESQDDFTAQTFIQSCCCIDVGFEFLDDEGEEACAEGRGSFAG